MSRGLGFLPIVAVLTAACLGASSGLYIKGVSLSGLALAACRMGIPFLVVLPYVIRRGRAWGLPGHRRALWLASGVNAVRMLLFILAYKLTAVGNAVVLLYLWPVFALILDSVVHRKRPTLAQIGILVLAFGGVVVMNLHRNFTLSGTDLLGSSLMILSAAGFAVTAIIFKKALNEVHETDTLYFQNAIGAVVYLPFLLMEWPTTPLPDLALGLVYGLTVGLGGFGLFFFAMKRLPLFQYSALAYSEVAFGLFFAVTVLGETLVVNQGVGAVLVLVASFAAQNLRGRGDAEIRPAPDTPAVSQDPPSSNSWPR